MGVTLTAPAAVTPVRRSPARDAPPPTIAAVAVDDPAVSADDRPTGFARYRSLLVPLALFLLGMWLTRHVWGGIAPEGDDLPYHLSRAQFGWSSIFRTGHLDGWSPRFGAGSQAFLLYGPGLAIVFSALRVVTFGLISDGAAMAVIMTVSYAAAGPGVWWVARSLRMSQLASGLAGLAGLCVSVPFGVGIAGTFDLGLVPNQLAVPMFLGALGLILRICGSTLGDSPEPLPQRHRHRMALGAGLLIASTVVTHPQSAVALALTLVFAVPFVLLHHNARWQPALEGLVETGIVTIVASTWWLVPLAVDHEPRAPLSDWGTPPFWTRVNELVTGKLLFTSPIAALVTVAVAVLLVQLSTPRSRVWRQGLGPGVVLTPIFLLLAGFAIRNRWGAGADVASSLPNRLVGYIGLLLALPLGLFLAEAGATALRGARRATWLLPAAVVIVAIDPNLIHASNAARDVPAMPPAVTAVSKALSADMEPWSRFAFAQENGFRGSFGILHPEFWIAWEARRNTVGDLGGNAVSPFDNYLQDHIFDGYFTNAPRRLADAGVTHLLVGPTDLPKMSAPEWSEWKLVWSGGGTSMFRRTAPAGQPAADSQITTSAPSDIRLTRYGPERLVWSKRGGPATDAVIAVAAFRKWHVRVDGQEIPSSATARPSTGGGEGLITVHLPAGSAEIEATFERTWSDYAGLVVTVAGALALIWGWWTRRRSRRRDGRDPVETPELPETTVPVLSDPLPDPSGATPSR